MSINYVALMKMREAEEDNAEACLDAAGSSHGSASDASQLADARCARCSEGDDFALLISGMDEALLKLSNGLLFERRQMMLEALQDLMSIRQAMHESL